MISLNILVRILKLVLRHKWRLAAAYASMIGAVAAYVTLPKLFGIAIDEIETLLRGGEAAGGTVVSIVFLILVLGSIRGVLTFWQTYLGESLAQVTVYELRNSFYDQVQHLSFDFHDKLHTGNLMSRAVVDVEAIRMFINVGIVRTPYFAMLFVAVAAILLKLDWRLGLLSMSFLPVVGVLTGLVRLQLRKIWLEVQEKMAELSTILQENLTGVRVVRAFASADYEEEKFDVVNEGVSVDMVKAARLQAFNTSFIVAAYLGAIGLVLWYGGSRVISGHMSAGELAQFVFYMQILAIPMRQTAMVVNSMARAMSAGQRLFEIIDTRSTVQERAGAVEMPRSVGHVRFEQVSFGYSSRVPALRNIDIDAEANTVVALLGAPGSGKSTLVHLIPRFYDVDSGRILIDGIDVGEMTLKSLRRNIGLVQQDVFLFTASLRENIAYGRHQATNDEIVEAAQVAQLHEFIVSLKDGYETVIGERGVTLSGGQRQRLSIARAVLLDPPILLLDDSTSSVDAHTEELIRTAMESVMRERTTFVIAHRLSTVHKADQILILSDGAIVERGTHTELLALGGIYRDIYQLQLQPQDEVMLEFETPVRAEEVSAP